jgi:ankyrin repeat protein
VQPDWEQAVGQGDLERLEHLLTAGAAINARDRYGQTALMIAARQGEVKVVRLLLNYGAGLNYTAKYGLSALMLAVIGGHADIVGALVEAGADRSIRGTGAPGFAGKTAWELAVAQSRFDMAAMLGGSSGPWSFSSG